MEMTPELLNQTIAAAVAAALDSRKKAKKADAPKKGRKPLTDEQKAENRAKTEALTIAAFAAKGYKNVKPRIDVMTYDKWIEAGRRVNKGEKSTKCGSWPLFHRDQTTEIATKH